MALSFFPPQFVFDIYVLLALSVNLDYRPPKKLGRHYFHFVSAPDWHLTFTRTSSSKKNVRLMFPFPLQTVMRVLATNHSHCGNNSMVYICIGTVCETALLPLCILAPGVDDVSLYILLGPIFLELELSNL